uniref:Putative ovule protein n=1 Tax=Solanum chacoense TaxID=4108 RepID=A0A0V0HFP5_SOLCH
MTLRIEHLLYRLIEIIFTTTLISDRFFYNQTSQTLCTHTSQLDKHLHCQAAFNLHFFREMEIQEHVSSERNAPALITCRGTVLITGNKGSSVISYPCCSSSAITSFIDSRPLCIVSSD